MASFYLECVEEGSGDHEEFWAVELHVDYNSASLFNGECLGAHRADHLRSVSISTVKSTSWNFIKHQCSKVSNKIWFRIDAC